VISVTLHNRTGRYAGSAEILLDAHACASESALFAEDSATLLRLHASETKRLGCPRCGRPASVTREALRHGATCGRCHDTSDFLGPYKGF